MKSLRSLLTVVVMSLCTVAFTQSDAPKSSAAPAAPKAVAQSDPQMWFDKVNNVAGPSVGQLTAFPPEPAADQKLSRFSLRVTSWGMRSCMRDRSPEDPTTRALCFIWIAIGRY